MIFDFLQKHSISYERFDHAPVFTCEEAERLIPQLPGTDLKNLFLRDGKGKRHFLLATMPEKKVDLKELGKKIGVKGLGFASAERLKKYLDLEPGSVTLLGIINDKDMDVQVLIDEEIWSEAKFQCHPLINTCTLVINRDGLEKFFSLCGHNARIVHVPASG